MSEKVYIRFSNSLPVLGGGIGAFTQINNIFQYFPAIETITATICITIIGGIFGYLTKRVLDKIFKCDK